MQPRLTFIATAALSTLGALGTLGAVATTASSVVHAAEPQITEAFTYQFSVGPIEGGRARLGIGRPFDRNGRTLVAVRGEAETAPWLKQIAPLRDEYQVLLETKEQIPVEVATIETGMRNRKTKTLYDDPTGQKVDVSSEGGRHSFLGKRTLPGPARDPVSFYMHLRKLPLKKGDEHTLYLLDRTYLSRITLKVVERETIFLENAHMKGRAIKLAAKSQRIDDDGNPVKTMPAYDFSVWLSDDADRVMMKMEVDAEMGRATIELTSYSKGAVATRN